MHIYPANVNFLGLILYHIIILYNYFKIQNKIKKLLLSSYLEISSQMLMDHAAFNLLFEGITRNRKKSTESKLKELLVRKRLYQFDT